MPISDLISFKAAFTTYLSQFGINFVFVGTLDEFLATLSKTAKYPVLFVERPTEDDDFDGNITFKTRLFYLVQGANLTDSDKELAFNQCRLQLRALMNDLKDKKLIPSSARFSIDYKDLYSGDGLIGAFTEADITGFGYDFHSCD